MEILAILQQSPFFSHASLAGRQALAADSTLRRVEEGALVARAGLDQTHVIYVASGSFSLYRRNPHREVTLLTGLLSAPSLFGDAECQSGSPWIVSARAEEVSQVVLLPNSTFSEVIAREPALLMRLYRDSCERHLLANFTAQALALHSCETRLLRLLLDLAHQYGYVEGDTAVIDRAVTQVELAAHLGVNRRTVARTLAPLCARGTISMDSADGCFRIHGLAQLARQLPSGLPGITVRADEQIVSVSCRKPRRYKETGVAHTATPKCWDPSSR